MSDHPQGLSGFCPRCNQDHKLHVGPAREAALRLMKHLEEHQRLDFEIPQEKANPQFSTDSLFGGLRGKMFGVLVCEKPNGTRQELKAFSGLYAGNWEIPGWVPPLFDAQEFWDLIGPVDKRIAALGRKIEGAGDETPQKDELIQQRKELSKKLMKEIHGLYRLNNFNNQQLTFTDIAGPMGLPSGTGDCCAPKLLNFAAVHGLKPLGIAEFFWGKDNLSASRHHGQFYPACLNKCGPILGSMLCGLDGSKDE